MLGFCFSVHLFNVFFRREIVSHPQGLDDFNGNGQFYVRLYWTGFGFQANIVEESVLLSA